VRAGNIHDSCIGGDFKKIQNLNSHTDHQHPVPVTGGDIESVITHGRRFVIQIFNKGSKMPERISTHAAKAAIPVFLKRKSFMDASASLLSLQMRAAWTVRRVKVVYARRAVFAS
jgi:hypothetical protein